MPLDLAKMLMDRMKAAMNRTKTVVDRSGVLAYRPETMRDRPKRGTDASEMNGNVRKTVAARAKSSPVSEFDAAS